MELTNEHPLVRPGTAAFGVALALFSLPGFLAPRFFGRMVGLTVTDDATASMVRSVSVRDLVMGIGLVSAAMHGSRLAPWLLMRTLCDGGDTVAVGIAVARGAGNVRLTLLGLLALAATCYGAVLHRLARSG